MGGTKGLAIYREIWLGIMMLMKQGKQTEKYLGAKIKTRKAVCYTRYEVYRNRFADVSRRDDHKYEIMIASTWSKLIKILLL